MTVYVWTIAQHSAHQFAYSHATFGGTLQKMSSSFVPAVNHTSREYPEQS